MSNKLTAGRGQRTTSCAVATHNTTMSMRQLGRQQQRRKKRKGQRKWLNLPLATVRASGERASSGQEKWNFSQAVEAKRETLFCGSHRVLQICSQGGKIWCSLKCNYFWPPFAPSIRDALIECMMPALYSGLHKYWGILCKYSYTVQNVWRKYESVKGKHIPV
jgi:hypothetical protein